MFYCRAHFAVEFLRILILNKKVFLWFDTNLIRRWLSFDGQAQAVVELRLSLEFSFS